jgi:uncharacterized protein YjbI with pentapeptide repeats
MVSFVQARLFLSYAREDEDDARGLAERLRKLGYAVFIDQQGLLIGQHFMTRLQAELSRSDALLFLHTAQSSESDWCHAEIYAAGALRLQLLRIRKSSATTLPDPLERMLSELHYLDWEGHPDQLHSQLREARRRALRRVAIRTALAGIVTAATVALTYLFFARWDAWQLEQRRAAVVSSITSSHTSWSGGQLAAVVGELERDALLLADVRALRDDPMTIDRAVRLNAWQVDQYLSHIQERRGRQDWSGVSWRGASLNGAMLVDVTVRHGRIERFDARDCKIAGVYFGPGPGQRAESGGLSLIDATFDNCDFWNVWFDATQVIGASFRDDKFRGVDLSLAGLAAVRFVSTQESGVITPRVTIFENSVIRGLPSGPEPGVLELATPEQEVLFEGVEFVRVTFTGWFRPEWFRNNHFADCTLPSGLTVEQLAKGGNRVE